MLSNAYERFEKALQELKWPQASTKEAVDASLAIEGNVGGEEPTEVVEEQGEADEKNPGVVQGKSRLQYFSVP